MAGSADTGEIGTGRGRIETLDLLRAIAVAAVVAFHYAFRGAAGDDPFTQVSLPALAPLAKYGFLGVQMFFVISGFVIAYSAERRTAGEFAAARVARIYPGFIFCMTLTFVLTLAAGAPRFHVTLAQWLANAGIFSPALKQPFMDGAYWSLVYEIIFYAWIAALMQFGWFRRHIDTIVIAWMTIAVLNQELQSGILLRVFLTDQSGFFAAGLVIYEMYCGRRGATIKLLLALTAVTAIVQSLHGTDWNRVHYHVDYSNWAIAGLSLLAIAAVGIAVRLRRVPLPPFMVAAIGGMTYPLYLLHQHAGYIVFNRFAGAVPPSLLIAGTAGAMIIAALSVWYFVERPGQRIAKRLFSRLLSRPREMAPGSPQAA